MAKRLLYTLAWGLAVCQVACSQKPKQQEYTESYPSRMEHRPSCTFVKELDGTFFCTTSRSWPSLGSQYLRHKLPELSRRGLEHEGIWASPSGTARAFSISSPPTSLGSMDGGPIVLLFTTKNPYDDSAWSGPIRIENRLTTLTQDIFWDDDGKVYMAVAAGIYVSEIDIDKGTATEAFLRSGMELGGTELNHTVTIARSRNIRGPYKAYEDNPILTGKEHRGMVPDVGHADLFQDASGNWWGVALATRSGPEWEVLSMGRETVLVPVQWKGTSGRVWIWVLPSRVNLTADEKYDPVNEGLGFPCTQTGQPQYLLIASIYYFDPKGCRRRGWHYCLPHTDAAYRISIISVKSKNEKEVTRKLRFKAETSGKPDVQAPETRIRSIPKSWLKGPIRLAVTATRDHKYEFSASSAAKPHKIKKLGYASAEIVSGGNGPFTGTIVGVFATKNGGKGKTPAYFSRWRYTAVAQEVGEGRHPIRKLAG
ncbi:glycosyl hydrolase [Fusarium oxysporum]|nr:glycosyl hydrolase [Fusarium oxysporum]